MKNQQALTVILAASPLASATAAITASVDMAKAHYATVLVPCGIQANTNATSVVLDVLHSDDTVVSNHTSLGTAAVANAATICGVYHVNWIGKKRYMRVTATPDTTTNGPVLLGGIVVLKQVDVAPTTSTTSSVTTV